MDKPFSPALLLPSWGGVCVWYSCSWERHFLASLVSQRCCWGGRAGPWGHPVPGEVAVSLLQPQLVENLHQPCCRCLLAGETTLPPSLRQTSTVTEVKLRCNSCIKSLTQSQFLTQSSLHYCPDFNLEFCLSITSLLRFSSSFERLKFFLCLDTWKREKGKGREGNRTLCLTPSPQKKTQKKWKKKREQSYTRPLAYAKNAAPVYQKEHTHQLPSQNKSWTAGGNPLLWSRPQRRQAALKALPAACHHPSTRSLSSLPKSQGRGGQQDLCICLFWLQSRRAFT